MVGAHENPADMFGPNGDEAGLEAFQQLRSFLHIMFQGSHPVIVFTSCDPKEGKSSHRVPHGMGVGQPRAIRRRRRRRSAPTETGRDFRSEPVAWRQRHFCGERPLGAPRRHGNRYLEVIPAGVSPRHPADVAAADIRGSSVPSASRTGPSSSIARPSTAWRRRRSSWPRRTLSSWWSTPASSISIILSRALAQLRASGANVVGVVLNRVRRPKAAGGVSLRPASQRRREPEELCRGCAAPGCGCAVSSDRGGRGAA